jgi:hypothetical protein
MGEKQLPWQNVVLDYKQSSVNLLFYELNARDANIYTSSGQTLKSDTVFQFIFHRYLNMKTNDLFIYK